MRRRLFGSSFWAIVSLLLALVPAQAVEIEANGWRIKKTTERTWTQAGELVQYMVYVDRTGDYTGEFSITDSRDPDVTDTYVTTYDSPTLGGDGNTFATWVKNTSEGSGFSVWYQVQVKAGLALGTRIPNRVTVSDTNGSTTVDFDLWVGDGNRTTSARPDTGEAGDPVNTATGEYFLPPAADLDLGGPLPLRFIRRYASKLNDPGTDWIQSALGRDWMHNFEVAVFTPGGDATNNSRSVLLDNGKIVRFSWSGDSDAGQWALNFEREPVAYELKSDGTDLWFLDPERELLYRFDFTNRAGVKEIVDRNGNALLVSRRADGRVTTVTDGLGRELAFAYSAASNLVRVTDGMRTVTFAQDDRGALTSVTNARGDVTSYAYDPGNSFTNSNGALLTSIQYPRGNTPLRQTYNTNGQVVAQTDAYGFTSTFAYGTNGITQVCDPVGTLEHRQNTLGAVNRLYDQGSNYFQVANGERGQLSSIRDRRGWSTTASYNRTTRKLERTISRDYRGTWYVYTDNTQVFTNRDDTSKTVTFDFTDLSRITNSNRSVQQFFRDGCGNVTARVDRAGLTWTATYNSRGQPLTVTNPRGGVRAFTYHADGTLSSASDTDTGATTYTYDALRRPIATRHPDGSREGWGLDALDRVTAFTNTADGVTHFEHDANGVLTRLTDPLGCEITQQTDPMDRATNRADSVGPLALATYDGMGRLVSETDRAGTNVYLYDARGWVTNSTRAGRTSTWTYDAEGNVTSVKSPRGHVNTFTRDKVGRISSWRDPLYDSHHQSARWTHDSMGQVLTSKNQLGQTTLFVYDPASRLVAITNPAGASATFAYSSAGDLEQRTDFDGNATTYGYTPMGRLAVVTNALGQVTRFAYDAAGRPVRNDYADGTEASVTYDAAGRAQASTDEGANTWRFSYDARGAMTAVTNPAGGVTTYAYNLDGSLQTARDSDTGAVSNRYDAARRPVEATLPDGATLQYEYNEHDEIVGFTDAVGRKTQFEYDADGQLTGATDPDSGSAAFAYDAAGRLTNATDRAGGKTAYRYDLAGQLSAVTDPTGVPTAYTRDALGRATTLTVGTSSWGIAYNNSGAVTNLVTPSGRAIAIVPDALQRVAQTVNALGRTNVFTRDARGRLIATTDPAGRVTQYAYEPRGLLAGVALPDSNTVAYAWNSLGLLSRVTDFNAAAWEFTYTPMGRLQSITDPLSRATQFGYDARGQLDTVTWPDSGTVDYTRDANGALVRAQYSGGPDIQLQRDANGLVTNASDQSTGSWETTALTRDAEGRVIATENPGTVFGATYDAAGRLATATYNNNTLAVTYTYAVGATGDGRLTRVSDDLTGTQVDFGYDTDRRLRTVTLPNGEAITYTWDDADRLTRLQSGDHVDIALTHDLSGRITETDLIGPLAPSGNVSTAIASLTYDAASQISSAGYSHDARGRLTDAPGRAYTWDGASRLTGIGSVALAYDGLGDVRTRSEGADTNRFFYNHAIGGAPTVAEQDEATGQMLRYYVWTPSGRLLYMIDAADGNKVYFYHVDQAGSTLALTDTNAAVTDAYAYDPYGRILARTGTNPQPFTFVGAWGVRQEGADGTLYHMCARTYDATIGRFLSPEPVWPQLAEPKALNPYQYVGADPIRFVDPTGAVTKEAVTWVAKQMSEAAGEALLDINNPFTWWALLQGHTPLGFQKGDPEWGAGGAPPGVRASLWEKWRNGERDFDKWEWMYIWEVRELVLNKRKALLERKQAEAWEQARKANIQDGSLQYSPNKVKGLWARLRGDEWVFFANARVLYQGTSRVLINVPIVGPESNLLGEYGESSPSAVQDGVGVWVPDALEIWEGWGMPDGPNVSSVADRDDCHTKPKNTAPLSPELQFPAPKNRGPLSPEFQFPAPRLADDPRAILWSDRGDNTGGGGGGGSGSSEIVNAPAVGQELVVVFRKAAMRRERKNWKRVVQIVHFGEKVVFVRSEEGWHLVRDPKTGNEGWMTEESFIDPKRTIDVLEPTDRKIPCNLTHQEISLSAKG